MRNGDYREIVRFREGTCTIDIYYAPVVAVAPPFVGSPERFACRVSTVADKPTGRRSAMLVPIILWFGEKADASVCPLWASAFLGV